MKFIHTSDWHIGRQFHNVSLLEDQEHVLEQLIVHIKEQAVDAVVIAGDIYDRSVPPATAVALLDTVLEKICSELNTPVILISGNHDSAERLGFAARQLKQSGLHILSNLHSITEPVSLTNKQGQTIDFYGIPYNDPEQVRHCFATDEVDNNNADIKDTVKSYDDAHNFLVSKIKQVKNSRHINVLISHCFIDGAEESESERPLSIGGADKVSYAPLCEFDYVALGHLHSPQFKGEKHIRYSGSLLKYSFSEQKQKKSFTLVSFDDSSANNDSPTPLISHLSLKPLRDVRIIEGEIDNIISTGKTDPKSDDYVLVRLEDKHAILDAMGKLRSVYPNILHLEKPGIMATGERQSLKREQLKRNELDMFKDFFLQVSGSTVSLDQNQAIEDIIQHLRSKG
ncbi:MAG: exonuclease SbcCD subunit D [Sinobacterium sp.]|nr:exonuclease SbcCD subunit D [Sinobacterium sp.]